MANRPKSFDTVLEEERREVLAMLEKRPARKPKGAGSATNLRRASSPLAKTRPPVRSMLDIGQDSTPTESSAAGARTESPAPPPATSIRSMLDIGSPTPAGIQQVKSAKVSVAEKQTKANNLHHRSLSDTAFRPGNLDSSDSDLNHASPYKLSGYLPRNPGVAVMPKRNTQAGKKVNTSSSPRSSIINPDTSKLVLTDGRVLEKDSAYHRLSDTSLTLSGNRLSLSSSSSRRASSGDATRPDRSSLEKDSAAPGDEEAVIESSEDDRSSDEERPRGRNKESRSRDGSEGKPLSIKLSKGPKSTLGRSAAAEKDGVENAEKEKHKVKSLLEPEITITGPPGDKLRSFRHSIHPHTSFDEEASGFNTPVDSDAEEDLTDIKRAQKLSVNMTSIVSTPATGRCVRTIYRGDFAKMQQEAHDNQRRVRKYLVATDLSEEAAHALEWTIGTVLRDGDTLLAIYCVDEELGISSNEPVMDDVQLQAQAAAVAATTKPSIPMPALPSVLASPLSSAFKLESSSANASPMGRGRGKAEQERFRAVQDITDRVSRLLRRTKLQVKVVIEVIHCKSPKHLITEVIDYLSPTLVILGSRGRSALKGVILGSFSNYLVTKSSVPVMVARKRLRKHSKYKRPAIRLANNLAANTAVRSLATAKID